MLNKRLLHIAILAVLFSSCGRSKDQHISFSGAFALYPLTIKWGDEYNKKHGDIKFDVQAGGAGKGMADALSNAVDVGMFSREITDVEKQKGVWWISLTQDAVFPTVSSENPFIDSIRAKGLTKDQFKAIFVDQSIKTWNEIYAPASKDLSKITAFTRSDASGAADSWAAFFGKKQEDLKGVGIFGDPGLADAVIKDKNSIGFNNTLYIYDLNSGKKHPGIEIIPIDLNGDGKIQPEENFYQDLPTILNAIHDKRYPAPPVRELYYISKGKPQRKEVVDFIKWVLSDGQQYVAESGFVPLSKERVLEELKKLN